MNTNTTSTSTSAGITRTLFPDYLYNMLENAENNGYDHLISWMPDGMSFKFKIQPPCFNSHSEGEKEAIVRWETFNQTSHKAFTRQLRCYGFKRNCKLCVVEYKHDLFVRGHQNLFHKRTIREFKHGVKATAIAKIKESERAPKVMTSCTYTKDFERKIRIAKNYIHPLLMTSYFETSMTPIRLTKLRRLVSVDRNNPSVPYQSYEISNIPTRLTNLVLVDSDPCDDRVCYDDDDSSIII